MTLEEFMSVKDRDIELTVYHNHQPIYFWFDEDPRLKWKVTNFGIISEFEMYVDIVE
jgi:hypothetical protein